MRAGKRILSVLLSASLLLVAMAMPVSAANYGNATIGFSVGDIYYMPYGISSVDSSLDLYFGQHKIDTSTPVLGYSSLNTAGYTINNESGGYSGYTVNLGLSAFDNGLEGATLAIRPDAQGVVSNVAGAANPPILMQGQPEVVLAADGQSSVIVLEGKRTAEDPTHAALGIWGFNFTGNLQVYTSTVRPGQSKAVMSWDIVIA